MYTRVATCDCIQKLQIMSEVYSLYPYLPLGMYATLQSDTNNKKSNRATIQFLKA